MLWCFDSIVKAPLSNKGVNKDFFLLLCEEFKALVESWRLQRTVALEVGKPMVVDVFTNVGLKVYRGHSQTLHELSLTDIPFLNPYDWISLFNIIVKDTVNYDPNFQFSWRMIRAYIIEIAKMDVQITTFLNRKPILKPSLVLNEVDQF